MGKKTKQVVPSQTHDDMGMEESDPREARESMFKKLGLLEEREAWENEMHNEGAHKSVSDKLSKNDKKAKKDRLKRDEKRNMNRFNAQLCVKLVQHTPTGEVHAQMLVEDSSKSLGTQVHRREY